MQTLASTRLLELLGGLVRWSLQLRFVVALFNVTFVLRVFELVLIAFHRGAAFHYCIRASELPLRLDATAIVVFLLLLKHALLLEHGYFLVVVVLAQVGLQMRHSVRIAFNVDYVTVCQAVLQQARVSLRICLLLLLRLLLIAVAVVMQVIAIHVVGSWVSRLGEHLRFDEVIRRLLLLLHKSLRMPSQVVLSKGMAFIEAEELLLNRIDLDHVLLNALLRLNHNLRVDLA